MVSYRCLNKLFIDKLTTRSGRLEISSSECLKSSSSSSSPLLDLQPTTDQDVEREEMSNREVNKENVQPNDEMQDQHQEQSATATEPHAFEKHEFIMTRDSMTLRRRGTLRDRVHCHKFAILDNDATMQLSPPPRPRPGALQAAISLALVLWCGHQQQPVDSTYLTSSPSTTALAARANSRAPPMSLLPPIRPPSSVDWYRISSGLLRQVERLPFRSPSRNQGSSYHESDRFPAQQTNTLSRVMNRLRQQIGARNTIRVHNAFRDFAWRLLSSMSMPTPVIYELRRQNFYPAEEDLANDNFFNRNTTKTIRSKRFLNINGANSLALARRSSKSDDDDEPETFRERLRARLEDLMSVSRRSLFGRVVRLPALFPFKRQEDEEGDDRTDGATGKRAKQSATGATSTTSSTTSRRPRLIAAALGGRRHRRNRELDRQMIEINGKQFYVDDDGELKEWKEQEK